MSEMSRTIPAFDTMTDRTGPFLCPRGHQSTEADHCSECGAAIDPVPAAVAAELLVTVQVDPSLVRVPDPDNPCPDDRTERLYPLDADETLVGRLSRARETEAEIAIADSGISRRHLRFSRKADGRFTVLDLNSKNGTQLNGVDLPAEIEVPIEPGDELVIGGWTRLAIRAQ
jgi:pSer/pThr/pTyr-binding forkhead associated (FHA) protein